MVVTVNGTVRERSTEAAREFVRLTRDRMRLEVQRHGEDVVSSRSYRYLLRSIEPEELLRMWPQADVDRVLDH